MKSIRVTAFSARFAALSLLLLPAIGSTAAAQAATYLASRASNGSPASDYSGGASLSADGRFVAFHSGGGNVVAGDTNGLMDSFVHDRLTGVTRRVSVDSGGAQANGETWEPRISGDGRFVVFASEASNLVAGDTNGVRDVFIHDVQTGTTARASVAWNGAPANERSNAPSSSFDGRYVVFDSFASNLVPGDANGSMADVFVFDVLLGTTTLVSVSTAGVQSNAPCQGAEISADGRFVAFPSAASNLVPGDTNGQADVFVRDLVLGTTILASPSLSGTGGNGESGESVAISGDGRFVAFVSAADNLVAGDTNGERDIFLFEVATGTVTRASLTSTGAQPNIGSFAPSISADGSRVVFVAGDSNFVPGDANGFVDVFLRDRIAGTTELVSQSTSGVQGIDFSTYPKISADGRYVGFESPADNLVELFAPAARNVYVRDALGCSPTVARFCTAATTTNGCQASISAAGTPSASAGAGFTVTVTAVDGLRAGLFFYGLTGPQAIPFGGGSSVLCASSPLQRTGVQSTGGTAGACDGQFVLDWNQFVVATPAALGVPFVGGETVWIQAWFRDPLAPGGSNLSDALWFDVCR